MMLGEKNHVRKPLHVPPWSLTADDNSSFNLSPTSIDDYSIFFQSDTLASALQRYLPSNQNDAVALTDFIPVDAHSCDQFRMFEFKVRKCARPRSHDWTECPFAHPGEKARRRDPRKFHYCGTPCAEFRRGSCPKGDTCEFAHGVFECWLHPARYRTQPCKDGMNCKRRVCFFAHSNDQLRVLSPRAGSGSGSGSPHPFSIGSDLDSMSPISGSPPMSPVIGEMVASLRQLQLNSWISGGGSSPRVKITRPEYFSLPNTPTRVLTRPGFGYFEEEEEPVMERVESGRDLRVKLFEKLSKENPLDRVDPDPNPDVDWVSDLIM